MATLIIVHSSGTGNEEILLNSDRIVSATSSTKKGGGGSVTSVKMAGQEGVTSITESLGDLVQLAHRRLEET